MAAVFTPAAVAGADLASSVKKGRANSASLTLEKRMFMSWSVS